MACSQHLVGMIRSLLLQASGLFRLLNKIASKHIFVHCTSE